MTPDTADRSYAAAIDTAISAGARWAIIEVTRENDPHSDGFFEGMEAVAYNLTTAPELPLLPGDNHVSPGHYAALVTPAAIDRLSRSPHRMVNRITAYLIHGSELPAGRLVMIHDVDEYTSVEDDAIDAARTAA